MSYVSSLYHIVFATRRRIPAIDSRFRSQLYAVLANEIKDLKSTPLLINGVHDHVHILLGLSPEVALSDLMRDIKSKSSAWMRRSGLFPLFEGWEAEYGAFSLSYSHRQAVYDYIASQQEHHAVTSLEDEYRRLVTKAGMRMFLPADDSLQND